MPQPGTPKTIRTFSQVILRSPAPLLLLDTSALLDIIRTVGCLHCPPGMVPAALEMIQMASDSPSRLWIVAAKLVQGEWEDNRNSVEVATRKHIKGLDRNIETLTEVIKHFGSLSSESVPNFSEFGVESRLKNVAENMLRVATTLQEDDGCSVLANRRVIAGWAPASKGRNELKDCMIIEHYIHLCRELRDGGFNSKCVFVSSNVNDYGKGGRPLPPLDEHFKAVGLEYVTDLAWASSVIRTS
jgi:hypothetical protein